MNAEIRRLYEDELLGATQIAPLVGVSRATVYRRLREMGVPIRPKPVAARLVRTGSLFDESEVARLYVEGFSANDIARRLNASKSSILAALTRQGVPTRTPREAACLRRNTGSRRSVPASHLVGKPECAICGETRWLEVHHVNGDRSDNDPSNLMRLCWEHHVFIEWLITKALKGARWPA